MENYGEEENVEKPTEVYLDYVAVNHLLKQAAYLHGYKDYLNMIQANKDALLSFSIFNDPNEFSGRNILKTANEFEALQDISLRLGIDGAIHAFMGFSITDYLLLAVLVLVCVAFLDERKKGLWNIVYALYGGRLRLAIQRVSILLCVSVIGVTLLYGTNLLVGFLYMVGSAILAELHSPLSCWATCRSAVPWRISTSISTVQDRCRIPCGIAAVVNLFRDSQCEIHNHCGLWYAGGRIQLLYLSPCTEWVEYVQVLQYFYIYYLCRPLYQLLKY